MALYRIRDPEITKVALVERPASGHHWHLFKSAVAKTAPADGQIIPPSGDWKIAYTVVAAPGHIEGGGITVDGGVAKGEDGKPIADVWDREAIRQAAHSFARNGGLTTDAHFVTDSAGSKLGRWAESYVAPVDHEIEGYSIKEGSWVLGIEPTPEGRQAIEAGKLGGVSVEGPARRELIAHSEASDELPDAAVDALVERTVVELVKRSALGLLAKISAAQRKALSPSDFALPPDDYPMDTRGRAANALARAAQNATPAQRATIKRRVCSRFPDLPSCKT